MTPAEIQEGLNQHTGTFQYYRLSPHMVLTDGTAWLAEAAGAYWLMPAIDSWQPRCRKDEMLQEIQFWTLAVRPDKSARLTCYRDTNDPAFHQDIEYTDFPLTEIRLYVEPLDECQSVILLPSEH